MVFACFQRRLLSLFHRMYQEPGPPIQIPDENVDPQLVGPSNPQSHGPQSQRLQHVALDGVNHR